MTDKDIIEKFINILNYGNLTGPYTRPSKPHWKPSYKWQVRKRIEVIRILNLFMPFFGERRSERANEVLRHYENIS